MSCCAIESTLLSPDGTTWGDLRDEMPEIARAEAMARAKIACEPIYKRRATINGNNPPETGLGPLAFLCLLTPSLTSPCYNVSGLHKFHVFCDIFSIPESNRLPVSFPLLHPFALWAAADPSLTDSDSLGRVPFKPASVTVVKKYLAAIQATGTIPLGKQ